MEITEVRVKLVDNKDERLKAFCSMTIDDAFVVRVGVWDYRQAFAINELAVRDGDCGVGNGQAVNRAWRGERDDAGTGAVALFDP